MDGQEEPTVANEELPIAPENDNNEEQVIKCLRDHCSTNIDGVLTSVFEDERIVLSSQLRMNRELRRLNLDKPVGIYSGSSSELLNQINTKYRSNMSQDAFNAAFTKLKEKRVILQCGRGRGKAVILLRESIARHVASKVTKKKSRDDEQTAAEIAELRDEVSRLSDQVRTYRGKAKEAEKKLDKIQNQQNKYTWS